ncbi:helix-turn-helix domain-containing protein [Primorskyibacter sp. S87]|uniref:AraC family transcriptional regulator n=1 Tax=Primorskyibacter sp. S87 TaxID=3415126 RepID=UPI003C7CE9E5
MNLQQIRLRDAEDISEFLLDATGMIPGYTQFSAGNADLEYDVVDLEGVSLLWARGRAHCRWQDQMSDDGRVHFGFALEAERGALSMGHDLSPSEAMLFLPGQDMDYVFLGPVLTLEIAVSSDIVEALGWSFTGSPLARLPEPVLRHLAQVCKDAARVVAGRNYNAPPAHLTELRLRVLDALEHALAPWLPHNNSSAALVTEIPRSHRVLRDVDRYMKGGQGGVFGIETLCSELGVGRRTLFYALRQSLGLTPRRYFEVLRLNELRCKLKAASADTSSVTQLATDLGFGDLGRMAGKYRAQFGEYPSATLRS